MRLLDRYLLRELLVPLGYCLAGFLIFWISSDLISDLDDFQEQKLSARDVALYYWLKAPEFLVTTMPVALLLALLYTLTHLARHHELTAIRAAGVSLWRLTLPYFVVGLGFSLGILAMNELWIPQSIEKAGEIFLGRRSIEEKEAWRWHSNLNFRNSRDGRIWNIEAFHLDRHEMKNPQVEWNLPGGLSHRLIAREAVRTNGVWVFYDVREFVYRIPKDFDPMTQQFEYQETRRDRLEVPEFTETPGQIKSEIKISQLNSMRAARKVQLQLSIKALQNYLEWHPDLNPRDEAILKTQLHARWAAPWTCLVVVLIAIPFGAPSGRRNVFVGVAGGIFITFAFFILLRFGLALGSGGHVPAWLGAWAPNFLFGAAGLWLTQKVR
jgi:lipopolysaccharide export system permease protein